MNAFAFGLTGYPLDHSLSPALHRAALAAAGVAGDYTLFPVRPGQDSESELQRLLGRVRAHSLHGLNVTLPYKQQICMMLADLTPSAANIGAVNTVFLRSAHLAGENTDAPAFWRDLHADPGFLSARGQHALVLGAGGAARAVAYILAANNWRVSIWARRSKQSLELVAALQAANPSAVLTVAQEGALESSFQRARVDLIVNATQAGMIPDANGNPWPRGLPLPDGSAVYDLVYNPQQTAILRQAQLQGLPARGGIGMLVEQAALAFELWTGRAADRDAMWTAAMENLIPGI
ncbi:MAG: shikimate dehydrogenase [Chloroflexi bacterium]|nr:shikimate dehydrogenase [Chloroflexota bacterium]